MPLRVAIELRAVRSITNLTRRLRTIFGIEVVVLDFRPLTLPADQAAGDVISQLVHGGARRSNLLELSFEVVTEVEDPSLTVVNLNHLISVIVNLFRRSIGIRSQYRP